MSIRNSGIRTVHVIAVCGDCEKRWENYRTAVGKARLHAEKTGHTVHVERGQTWTYNRKLA